ncbi:Crp/Fnr family transcriptional regulator [Sphingomonas sp. RB3P16]|uniref:Crp/Fnr family transcriptional regulator n=1 Tax=Parasphingomonas frigoris TaxID=3096163 RepID=UPI002FC59089
MGKFCFLQFGDQRLCREMVTMQITVAKRKTSELLRGSGLWQSSFLSDEERRALERAAALPRSVQSHVDLVREGDHPDNLFMMIEGWAARYTTTREGHRQFSALLVAGDICNLDTLLFDQSGCSVRMLTPAKIVALPRKSIAALATQHPGIARTFTWLALVENAALGKLTLTLGCGSAKKRLAHLLCELSVRVSTEQDDESSFDFPLTQEQIGDALGLTAVHVNRMMKLLRAEGLVEIANRTMTLRSIAGLRRIGGFDPRYLHVRRAEADNTTRMSHAGSTTSHSASSSRIGV